MMIKIGKTVSLHNEPECRCEGLRKHGEKKEYVVHTLDDNFGIMRIKILHPQTDSPTWVDATHFIVKEAK